MTISLIMMMSSSSFWSLWVSIELFTFFLITFLMSDEPKLSKSSILMYFLTQFIASLGLLFGSLTFINSTCCFLLFMSALMKMACFPFHSWFMKLIVDISWLKVIILMTISKIPPMLILMFISPMKYFIWILILSVSMITGGFSSLCLKTLLGYSSITHSIWMVISSMLSKMLLLSYFVMYILSLTPFCYFLLKEKIQNLGSILISMKGSSASFNFMVLSMSGVPPFISFFPKLLVIVELCKSAAIIESSLLGLLSIVPVYLYFKIGCNNLSMKSHLGFSFKTLEMKYLLSILFMFSVLVTLLLLSLSLI